MLRAYLEDDRSRSEDRVVVGAEFRRFLRLVSLRMNRNDLRNLQINDGQALMVRIAPIVFVVDLRVADGLGPLRRLLTLRTSENLQNTP